MQQIWTPGCPANWGWYAVLVKPADIEENMTSELPHQSPLSYFIVLADVGIKLKMPLMLKPTKQLCNLSISLMLLLLALASKDSIPTKYRASGKVSQSQGKKKKKSQSKSYLIWTCISIANNSCITKVHGMNQKVECIMRLG